MFSIKTHYLLNIGYTLEIFAMEFQCYKNVDFNLELFAIKFQHCRNIVPKLGCLQFFQYCRNIGFKGIIDNESASKFLSILVKYWQNVNTTKLWAIFHTSINQRIIKL